MLGAERIENGGVVTFRNRCAGGEQAAIAAVLSDMDAEFAVLERRRDRIHVMKQGTMRRSKGGVRLVETSAVEASC